VSRRLRHRQHAKALSASERTAPPPSSAQDRAAEPSPSPPTPPASPPKLRSALPQMLPGDPTDAFEHYLEDVLDL
jgi:hypothetical protein